MPSQPTDAARHRGVLLGCLVGLVLVAAVVVVVAVATGSYLVLTGLIAVAAGGFGCWIALRDEADAT